MTTVNRTRTTGTSPTTRTTSEAPQAKPAKRKRAEATSDEFAAEAGKRTTVGGPTRRQSAELEAPAALRGELSTRLQSSGGVRARATSITPDPLGPPLPPKPEGLTIGDTGRKVKTAEKILQRAGFKPGNVDGKFTENTEKAVQGFQDAIGLKPTGVLDDKTYEQLKHVNRRMQKHGKKSVGIGQHNGRVRVIEGRLKKLGYDVGKADGTYDTDTAKAVKDFRHDQSKKIRKYGSTLVGQNFQKELRQETRDISHDPYHVRVKPSAERRVADKRTALAAARKNDDGTRGLGRGDQGAATQNIKRHLQNAGYDPGRMNDRFDERTEGALRNFQRRSKLPVTGRADSKTWSELRKATLEAKGPASPKQTVGERSKAVKDTEKLLKKLGYKTGDVDGTYTKATERAVDQFRKKHKLGNADGVGTGTLKRMRKAVREQSANGPISAHARKQMKSLVRAATANSAGKPALGWCLREVGDILERVDYGKIGRGKAPRFPYARNFGEWLNRDRTYDKMGLRKLKIDNPYKAPPGAIVVVRPGTPGTSHPTAGDISIAVGGGRFLNDGEMGYGGSGNFPKGNGHVIGIYVPK